MLKEQFCNLLCWALYYLYSSKSICPLHAGIVSIWLELWSCGLHGVCMYVLFISLLSKSQ